MSARRTRLGPPHHDCLEMFVTAPPVDGKANAEIVQYLSELFGVSRSHVIITAGATSKRKTVRLEAESDRRSMCTALKV